MVLQELVSLYDRLAVSSQVPKLFHSALPIGVDAIIDNDGRVLSAIPTVKSSDGYDPEDFGCQVTSKSEDRRNDWYDHPHGIVEQLQFFVQPDVTEGPTLFSNKDFVNKGLSNLLERFCNLSASDRISQFLWEAKFSVSSKEIIRTSNSAKLRSSSLIDQFNSLLQGESLHDKQCFMELSLSQEARTLISLHLKTRLTGDNLIRLNRHLLEDAYPNEIAQGLGKTARGAYRKQLRGFLSEMDSDDLRALEKTIKLLNEGSQLDQDSPHAKIKNAAAQKIRIGKGTYAINWEDLVAHDPENKFRTKAKKLHVRWRLVSSAECINQLSQVQEAWQHMQNGKSADMAKEEFKSTKRISTLSGESVLPARTIFHLSIPRKGGKLISFNESSEYNTYSSAPLADHELYITGIEEVHKYGQSLRWLAANCQVRVGDILYVIWRDDVDKRPWSLFKEQFGEDKPIYDCGYGDEVTAANECRSLVRAKLGMQADLKDLHHVQLMGIKLAKGRLSLVGFHRITLEDFADANAAFVSETAVGIPFRDKKAKSTVIVNRSPTIHTIIKAANPKSGPDKKNKIPVWWDAMARTTLFKSPLPLSLVNVLVRKALTRQDDESVWLSAAVYRNYLLRTRKEDLKMSLDINCTDRSYRAGRLIAVHYWIQTDRGKGNPNNKASSLMQSIIGRPQLIGRVEQASFPYLKRMAAGQKRYFENLLGEIYDSFMSEGLGTTGLDAGRVIVGYHHQLTAVKAGGNRPNEGTHNEVEESEETRAHSESVQE